MPYETNAEGEYIIKLHQRITNMIVVVLMSLPVIPIKEIMTDSPQLIVTAADIAYPVQEFRIAFNGTNHNLNMYNSKNRFYLNS